MGSQLSESAMHYAHLNLPVFPLIPRSKYPMFKGWPDQATSDPEIVSRWWKQNPDSNIGLACGHRAGIFVIDVDPKNGGDETYEHLVSKHGRLPDTWQQITGGGGFQQFYRYPNFHVHNAAGLWPGVDIRGEHGYVVMPPSIHPTTGREYAWDGLDDIENTQLAEAPAWVLEALYQRSAGGTTRRSDKLPVALQIPSGLRNETLTALAGAMRRMGMELDELRVTLRETNQRRCVPALFEQEIELICQSVLRYRPSDRDLFTSTATLWRLLRKHEALEEQLQEQRGCSVVDGLTVYRTPAADTKCIVDGLLYHGLTIFAGRPKSGKSWLTLEMALNVARGELVLGRAVLQPGRVVYAALEESQQRTSGRMQKLLDAETPLLQNISLVYALKPLGLGGLEQLDELISNQAPTLVVVDTFLALVQGNGNERRDVLRSEYREIDALHKLAERRGTAILLVHHTRKGFGNESGLDSVSGTSGITAAADAVWTLKREDQGLSTLEVVGRECEEQSIGMKFRDGGVGWEFIGDGNQVRGMKDNAEILRLLQEEGQLAPSKVALMLRMNANRVRDALYEMHRNGFVGRNSGGAFYAEPAGRQQS